MEIAILKILLSLNKIYKRYINVLFMCLYFVFKSNYLQTNLGQKMCFDVFV